MSWQEEMREAIVRYLVSNGIPVDNSGRDPFYGYIADDYQELHAHMAACAPDMGASSFEDTEWTEFAGTFEDHHHRNGVEATVTCVCGQVQGRKWRITAGYAEMLQAITEV